MNQKLNRKLYLHKYTYEIYEEFVENLLVGIYPDTLISQMAIYTKKYYKRINIVCKIKNRKKKWWKFI